MTPTARFALLALVASLIVPATAQAGGWATIELGQAPSGIVAGTPWQVELIVKQHGVTLLDDAKPSLRIDNGHGVTRTFHARHVGPGRYAAAVTFPSAGTWRTRIYDGWTDAVPHQLSALSVAAGDPPGGFPWEQMIAIALVALLWIGGWVASYGWPHPRRERRRAFTLHPPRAV
jgi:hypothetical protein